MNKIKIHLHGENAKETKTIEVSSDSTIKEIINTYRKEVNPSAREVDDIELFVEDEENPRSKESNCDSEGIKHHHNIHCHRCKKIEVDIVYNGAVKRTKCSPSTTGGKLVKIAAKEFGITEKDAADLELVLPNGSILKVTDHIGLFVSFPHCEIKLNLVHHKPIQG